MHHIDLFESYDYGIETLQTVLSANIKKDAEKSTSNKAAIAIINDIKANTGYGFRITFSNRYAWASSIAFLLIAISSTLLLEIDKKKMLTGNNISTDSSKNTLTKGNTKTQQDSTKYEVSEDELSHNKKADSSTHKLLAQDIKPKIKNPEHLPSLPIIKRMNDPMIKPMNDSIQNPPESHVRKVQSISDEVLTNYLYEVIEGNKSKDDFHAYLCDGLAVIVNYKSRAYDFKTFCAELKTINAKRIKTFNVKTFKDADSCITSMTVTIKKKFLGL